jgi:hypothetical protein
MARLTKAEKLALEHAEREEREATAAAHYFPRLMAALATATNYPNNFELKVKDGMFLLYNRNTEETYALSPSWNREVWELDNLETELEHAEQARIEAKRIDDLARAAFNKLTKEEQQALGLNSRYNW